MKRILITGATGFLGRHVVDTLLQDGGLETVRLLSRGSHPWAAHASVETIHGDIVDPAAVERAVKGVEAVVHLAGRVGRGSGQAAEFFETHIEGTRNVCDAALKYGRPRIVLASSSGTIAVSRTPDVHDETAPYAVDLAGRWPYYLSKIYQEKLALFYHAKENLPVVILSPSLLLGPGDVHMSSTCDVKLFLDRQVATIPSGGLNFIDVRDAARTFITAVERGQPGRRYLLGGHDMTMREFFYLIQYVSGVRAPLLELGEPLARAGTHVLQKCMHLFGKTYPIDDASIEMAYRYWYCSNARAKAELALEVRPAEETLRDTVDFIRHASK